MTTYSTLPVSGFLDALASNEPVPGGGSAAAFAGAAGVSLLLMVAGLPKTRTGAPEEVADLAEAAAALRPLRQVLIDLIDRDSHAYEAVLAAYRLERATGAQQQTRREAIQTALRAATDTPLETLHACAQALLSATTVARHALLSAHSDAAVGVELLTAAARGAALNVDINLTSITDDGYVQEVRAERGQLEEDSAAQAMEARRRLAAANRDPGTAHRT